MTKSRQSDFSEPLPRSSTNRSQRYREIYGSESLEAMSQYGTRFLRPIRAQPSRMVSRDLEGERGREGEKRRKAEFEAIVGVAFLGGLV